MHAVSLNAGLLSSQPAIDIAQQRIVLALGCWHGQQAGRFDNQHQVLVVVGDLERFALGGFAFAGSGQRLRRVLDVHRVARRESPVRLSYHTSVDTDQAIVQQLAGDAAADFQMRLNQREQEPRGLRHSPVDNKTF